MNKIESIWYFQMSEIPTLAIDIIDPSSSIDKLILKNYRPNSAGWVARSGNIPSVELTNPPEGTMPWHATKPIKEYDSPDKQLIELVVAIEEIYRGLNENQVVFVHPQRVFQKSGVLSIDSNTAMIEAVTGWPEALSHGKINPIVRYMFNLPSLFINPVKTEGETKFLTEKELWLIGNNIERRLNYSFLLKNLSEPLAIEFSFGPYKWGYGVSAHDIQVGKSKNFETWYDLACSIRERAKEHRFNIPNEIATSIEDIFVKSTSYLDSAEQYIKDPKKVAEYLSRKYNLAAYSDAPLMSMGSRKWEICIEKFLEPSKVANQITPIDRYEFEKKMEEIGQLWEALGTNPFDSRGKATDSWIERGLVIEDKTTGQSYLWPTEALMINQKIPGRENSNLYIN